MSGFTNYLENAVMNHVFGGSPYTAPSNVYLALFTVTPSDAGGGTEVSSGGYSREVVSLGSVIDGAISNSSIISFTATGGDFGTIVATGLYDASTFGNLLTWAPITPATINDGDTLSFAIGSVAVSLD